MKLKKVISVALLGAMALSIAGCAKKIESIKAKDFKNAIEEVIDEDDYSDLGDNIYYYGDNMFIDFYEFEDADDATDTWEDILDSYNDMTDDKKFDGSRRLVNTSNYGYILLDGECDDKNFLSDLSNVYFLQSGRSYYYGGIFFVDDEIIVVMTTKDKDGNREDIDTILAAMGYPKP